MSSAAAYGPSPAASSSRRFLSYFHLHYKTILSNFNTLFVTVIYPVLLNFVYFLGAAPAIERPWLDSTATILTPTPVTVLSKFTIFYTVLKYIL